MARNKREKHPTGEYSETESPKKGHKARKILLAFFLALVLLVYLFFGLGAVGVMYTEQTLNYWTPDYAMINIQSLLDKEELTEADYETLYRQTGLTKLGVDDLLDKSYGKKKILDIQESFFHRRDLVVEHFGPFCYSESMDIQDYDDFSIVTDLQDGDILVSSSMRVSWWRFGHSALVVDGKASLLLEAMEPGLKSMINYVATFEIRPNFIVLRPKVDAKVKKEVAAYAKENLVGLEYDIFPGVFSPKYEEPIEKTHCSHIVWYAYKKFGIDIDSNGGGIVTPHDIFKSEYMKVVQVFGMDPDTLWE